MFILTTIISFIKHVHCEVIDNITVPKHEQVVLPGDDLKIMLKMRSHLYLGLEEGIVVLYNNLMSYDPEIPKDPTLPVSLRKMSLNHYEIFIDGMNICSYGLLNDVGECQMDPSRGDPDFIIVGDDDSFTIQGRGGCFTRYDPSRLIDNFKHGVRIDFCDGNENQRWTVQRKDDVTYMD